MDTELFASHGYVRCLRQGLAYALKNLGNILLVTWVPLLLLAVSGVLADLCYFMPFVRDGRVGVVGYGSLALFVVMLLQLQAAIVWKQHDLGAGNSSPRALAVRDYRYYMNLSRRNYGVTAANALVLGGVGAALWLGADRLAALARTTAVSTLGWMGIGLGGLLLFIAWVGLLAFLQLFWANFMYGNQRFFDTLRVTFHDRHQLGRTAALQFVQLVYAFALLAVFCLPYVLFLIMEGLARQTQMQGDAVSLPGYYTFLHYAALLLGVAGIALTMVLALYPTLYNWCAIQSEKEAA